VALVVALTPTSIRTLAVFSSPFLNLSWPIVATSLIAVRLDKFSHFFHKTECAIGNRFTDCILGQDRDTDRIFDRTGSQFILDGGIQIFGSQSAGGLVIGRSIGVYRACRGIRNTGVKTDDWDLGGQSFVQWSVTDSVDNAARSDRDRFLARAESSI
jgi:hypothetical protein